MNTTRKRETTDTIGRTKRSTDTAAQAVSVDRALRTKIAKDTQATAARFEARRVPGGRRPGSDRGGDAASTACAARISNKTLMNARVSSLSGSTILFARAGASNDRLRLVGTRRIRVGSWRRCRIMKNVSHSPHSSILTSNIIKPTCCARWNRRVGSGVALWLLRLNPTLAIAENVSRAHVDTSAASTCAACCSGVGRIRSRTLAAARLFTHFFTHMGDQNGK